MSDKEYLKKIEELRKEALPEEQALLDYLEQYRPMENYDGVADRSSSGIQDDLVDIVDIPINTIARYMKELGYKVVIWHGYAYWNMRCAIYDNDKEEID